VIEETHHPALEDISADEKLSFPKQEVLQSDNISFVDEAPAVVEVISICQQGFLQGHTFL